MLELILRGRVAPNVLRAFPNLTQPFREDPSVVYAFVMRQDEDIPLGTTFRVIGLGANGQEVMEQYRLVAVSQQYDHPMDEIPHGWKTICAFKWLSGPRSMMGLPLVGEWYEQSVTELVLRAEP
ncbi:hypothetical protein [Hymenobacter sp. GOD-10R]|uniref:hypothetical protein n=1 Tax=Hymenobacter sp. GOD-10R TaxID=3093922 RepID=UPI002D7988DF|nr:hypothetical protein [Hymenobacter sp. GOD-10R]WRQ31629.1 hypothetical protein SD425_27745 [Hymenobacter sp. GOD-10R]